jgi:hypothetical protein
LDLAGADYDRDALLATPPANTSRRKPHMTEELAATIRRSERAAMERFGYT